MSSLRLALKLSMESGGSSTAPTVAKDKSTSAFQECDELLKSQKGKRKRNLSEDNFTALNKADDVSLPSMKLVVSESDQDLRIKSIINGEADISKHKNTRPDFEKSPRFSKLEDKHSTRGLSQNPAKSPRIVFASGHSNPTTTKSPRILFDSFVVPRSGMVDKNTVAPKTADLIANTDIAHSSISRVVEGRHDSAMNFNDNVAKFQKGNFKEETIQKIEKVVKNENFNQGQDAIENQSEADETPSTKPVKHRRRGGLLGLRLEELPVEDEEHYVGGDNSSSRNPRAAAVAAKTRLAVRPGRGGSSRVVEDNHKDDESASAKKERNAINFKRGRWPKHFDQSSTPAVSESPWVACDKCEKWRKLPKNVNSSTLPEKWFCSMNIWDSNHNSCEAEEEGEGVASTKKPTGEAEEATSTANNESSNSYYSNNNWNAAFSSFDPRGGGGGGKKSSRFVGGAESSMQSRNQEQSDSEDVNVDTQAAGTTRPGRRGGSYASRGSRQSSNENESSSNSSDKVNWVECNACKKWRRVPSSIDVDALPEVWYCSFNTWNLSYSRCTAKQEQDSSSSYANDSQSGGFASSSSRRQNSSIVKGGRTSGTTAQPIQWVQCERKTCNKWRKVPLDVDMSKFPEKWFCEMNTWNAEKANCNAPEDVDTEIDPVNTKGSRTQLAIPNSKGPGALSYRRIIFGADFRIRSTYNEKNKTGYGIFSFPETVPIGNNNSGNDESIKKVKYWKSSLYDESGIHYVSALKRGSNQKSRVDAMAEAGTAGHVGTTTSEYFVPSREERKSETCDSILHHVLSNGNHVHDQDNNNNILKLPLNKSWPKKNKSLSNLYNEASAFEKQNILRSIVITTLMAHENKSLLLTTLFDTMKVSRFSNSYAQDCNVLMSMESLKDCIRRLEEDREVSVGTDSEGSLYAKLIVKSSSDKAPEDYLPPKLRYKKSLVALFE